MPPSREGCYVLPNAWSNPVGTASKPSLSGQETVVSGRRVTLPPTGIGPGRLPVHKGFLESVCRAELLPERQLPEVVDGSRSPMVRCAGNASQVSAGTERISGRSVNATSGSAMREPNERGRSTEPMHPCMVSVAHPRNGRLVAPSLVSINPSKTSGTFPAPHRLGSSPRRHDPPRHCRPIAPVATPAVDARAGAGSLRNA